MKKLRFKIGDEVFFAAIWRKHLSSWDDDFEMGEAEPVKTYKRIEHDGYGIITGLALRFEGTIKEDVRPGGYMEPPEYHGNFLDDIRPCIFWLVRQGMMNLELMVDEKDITRVISVPHFKFPIKYSKRKPMSDKDRNILRKIMRGVPRDVRGRWKKVED